jgi:hypothetical protein
MWNANRPGPESLFTSPESNSEEILIEAGAAGHQWGEVGFTDRWRRLRAPGKGIHAESKRGPAPGCNRIIARSCSIGQATVHCHLEKAAAAGLSWPLPEEGSCSWARLLAQLPMSSWFAERCAGRRLASQFQFPNSQWLQAPCLVSNDFPASASCVDPAGMQQCTDLARFKLAKSVAGREARVAALQVRDAGGVAWRQPVAT